MLLLLQKQHQEQQQHQKREYHLGHVKAEVLSPILSECERLTSSEWSQFYPLSAQQLSALNEAQAREGKPDISPATFLDMNSINLVDDPFKVWEERYKVYVALHHALRAKHNHYPVTMDQFLSWCFPFGCEGRPGGIQGVVPFECKGRPAELGVVASLGGLNTQTRLWSFFSLPAEEEKVGVPPSTAARGYIVGTIIVPP
ncbi:hypothetical protein Taro_042232 [Colocasia esculenta]|uniref:Uncharacterized protein n=1 Tax=Colocasia esculenta TaxID=4460 RepID=A0A843WY18_COLES|nr:hypothetical protein [Colocasia esculenta]